MAKITRFNGNLVAPASAALGTERTIFGEVTQSDDLTDQFSADLLRGWAIVGPSDFPTLQDFNAMGYTLGQIHAYLHQMGVAEYNALQEYHTGSITNVSGVLYVSLVDANVGNAPASSPSQWSPQSGSGLIVFDTAGVTAWTVPLAMQLGIIKPKVTVRSGGAGGGRRPSGGPGGGAGAEAVDLIDLTGVTSVTVTVGAGGIGTVSPNNADGTNGGASSFGAYMSAGGGLAGITNAGGISGTAVGGALNSGLGDGGSFITNGAGASSGGRGGGAGGEGTSGGGRPGNGYGGGGGGSITSDAGNGFRGFVRIEW